MSVEQTTQPQSPAAQPAERWSSLRGRQPALTLALKWGLFAGFCVLIVASFISPSPMSGAAALTANLPDSPNAHEVYRILYYHVPQAFGATIAFITAMFYAVRYLMRNEPDYDFKSMRANELGLVFAVLAIITGSVFSKFTWGFWWDWAEVRMTSVFILALMYGGYFALRSSIPDHEKRARLSAVMSLLFGLAALFLIFVVPRVAASRHPNETVAAEGGMSNAVRLVFWPMVICFCGIFFWIWGQLVRLSRLEYARDAVDHARPGVTPTIEDGGAAPRS